MIKKILFQAHWIIGITAGIVLAFVGVTGAILSFETEIARWLNRDVRTVQPLESGALSPPELLARIREAHPERTILSIAVSADPTESARVTFAPVGEAVRAEGGGGGGPRGPRGEVRYVNPYTGEVFENPGNKGETFLRSTRSLHRWLTAGEFGNRDIGKQIVGASTVLLIVLALSGLYLRWPRYVASLRTWFTFDPALKGRSFLWHLHAVLGTWVLIPYLIMSLTGLYWSYEWYRNGLYSLAGVERPAPRGEPQARGGEGGQRGERGQRGGGPAMTAQAAPGVADATIARAWDAFVDATQAHGFSTATLTLPRGPAAAVEIRYVDADPPHERAANTIQIDAQTGAIREHVRYADKRAGEKFMSSIFPLHSGSFFGNAGLIIFMIASLAMPVFAITGWMLYLDRRKKKYAARALQGAVKAKQPATNAAPISDLLIGFASQAGFARQIAWQTAGALQAAGVSVHVESLARLGQEQLQRFRRALFVVSTFGEGEPPDDARVFVSKVMKQTLPLHELKFGLLALGDKQYRTFCAFGRSLESWLRRQGAQSLFPPVEVDRGNSTALEEWQKRLSTLVESASMPQWTEPEFSRWRLVERRLLNPGSVSGPLYHIELEPVEDLASWNAGDIAEVRVGAEGMKREFSIASLPADGRIHLLVRQVRRADGTLGVGSGWLTQSLNVGDEVELRVRSNPSFHAPHDSRRIILIGNGTGMAGLRSHLRAYAAAGRKGAWLIFGERNASTDFLYRDEIEAWQSSGVLEHVDLAFSRDQAERVYVQQRLREQADRLREWVRDGAWIYVCGSLEGMAPGVDAALKEILGTETVERLAAEGGYRRDVY